MGRSDVRNSSSLDEKGFEACGKTSRAFISKTQDKGKQATAFIWRNEEGRMGCREELQREWRRVVRFQRGAMADTIRRLHGAHDLRQDTEARIQKRLPFIVTKIDSIREQVL